MEIEQYGAVYMYDAQLDLINIEINKEYVHKCSIELEFGVFLDFDEDDVPVNLEIISASKIMGIDKKCLINPEGNVVIVVGKDVIDVGVSFKFEENSIFLQFKALNDLSIPISQTSFALA